MISAILLYTAYTLLGLFAAGLLAFIGFLFGARYALLKISGINAMAAKRGFEKVKAKTEAKGGDDAWE